METSTSFLQCSTCQDRQLNGNLAPILLTLLLSSSIARSWDSFDTKTVLTVGGPASIETFLMVKVKMEGTSTKVVAPYSSQENG